MWFVIRLHICINGLIINLIQTLVEVVVVMKSSQVVVLGLK